MKTRLPMIAALAAGLMVAVLPPAVAMAQPSTGTAVQQQLQDIDGSSSSSESGDPNPRNLQQVEELQGRMVKLAQHAQQIQGDYFSNPHS